MFNNRRFRCFGFFASPQLTLALASLGAVANAQTSAIPLGKNADIEIREPAALGTTVLKPGHYRFRHVTDDGQHYVVVLQQQTRGAGTNYQYGAGSGTEVARVQCDVVALDAKVTATEVHFRDRPNGPRAITQIRIPKEGAAHLVALEPKA